MQKNALRFSILASFLNMSGALAAEPIAPLIPEFPPDQEICFGRIYDAAHLSRHPRQKVSAFWLFRSLTADSQEETKPLGRSEIARKNVEWEAMSRKERYGSPDMMPGTTHLDVLVKFKDRPAVYKQRVECQKLEGKGFSCGVDCDGGGFGAQQEGTSLVIRQSEHSSGLRVQSGCSSGDESAPEVRVDPKDDALVFKLEPKPIAACHAARDEARPAWVRSAGRRCASASARRMVCASSGGRGPTHASVISCASR